jgi:hypothetical protein
MRWVVILFGLQCKLKWKMENYADSRARIGFRKIAFKSKIHVPQPECVRGRRSGRESRAPKPSRLPRLSSVKRFPRNSAKSAGKSATITEAKSARAG